MLGDNIAALRKQRGMTQQTLADALYVTRQTISKWEKNLSVPARKTNIRCAGLSGAVYGATHHGHVNRTYNLPLRFQSAQASLNFRCQSN